MNFIDTFNNRERAIGIWLLVFLVWVCTKKEVRNSIASLLKTMFLTKVSVVFIGTLVYTAAVVFLLSKVSIWQPLLIKDTIFWVIGTGFVLLLNINKATQDTGYFKKVTLDSLRLMIVLEFVLGLYSFSFLVEMILIPLLFLVVAMNTLSGMKGEYKPVKKLTDLILAIFGIYTLVFALSHLLSDYHGVATFYNLRVFVLQPILTLSYLPFLYVFALFMAYETLFVRLNCLHRGDKKLVEFIKRRVFVLCCLNLGLFNRFVQSTNAEIFSVKDKQGVLAMIEKFKKNTTKKK